jgi:TetR/AcrR family transcriptional regulator
MTNDDPKTTLIEAAERVLARDGRAGLTTRRLAAEAGLNPGLVHYHFGSIDTVMALVMERAAARSLARLEAAVGSGEAFVQRWRAIVADLDEQVRTGEARLLAQLAAVALTDDRGQARHAQLLTDRRALIARALEGAAEEYSLSPGAVGPAAVMITAVCNGLVEERLAGIRAGHAELERWIEGWLLALKSG